MNLLSDLSENYEEQSEEAYDSTRIGTVAAERIQEDYPDYLPIYKGMLLNHEIYDQEYNYGEYPPLWCKLKKRRPIPLKKTKKRVEMARRNGEDVESYKWLIPKLPTFSVKKGPLDFIEKLW